jgi:type III pantothenate kinase
MLLTVDIGNTNTTLGIFDKEVLIASFRLSTDHKRQPDEYAALIYSLLPLQNINTQHIDKAIICSVVPPLTNIFQNACKIAFKIDALIVGPGIKTGIEILYDSPRDVGADRIADAVAAHQLYGSPVIVVDLGTATVLDALDRNGNYLGGAIFPGIQVSAEALFLGTSQLRRVELSAPKEAIGKNTISALQSGLVYGHVSMIEGMIIRFKKELGQETIVVATGGLAYLIANETEVFQHVNINLTLIGLRMIHDLNQ